MPEIVNSIPQRTAKKIVRIDATPHGAFVQLGTYSWPDVWHHNVGQELTFTATLTGSQPSDVKEYLWDFGDGTRAVGNPVTHTYKVGNAATAAHVRVLFHDGSRAFATLPMMLAASTPAPDPVPTGITRTITADFGAWEQKFFKFVLGPSSDLTLLGDITVTRTTSKPVGLELQEWLPNLSGYGELVANFGFGDSDYEATITTAGNTTVHPDQVNGYKLLTISNDGTPATITVNVTITGDLTLVSDPVEFTP